jgi:hypothetical protein
MAATITDSVGEKGKNKDADVRVIQDLFDMPATGTCGTGLAGADLIARIKRCQETLVGLTGKNIDGTVNPGGPTLKTLIQYDFERWGYAGPAVLTEDDLKGGAASLGLEVALVKAVANVETMGAGFLQSGKPTILFERRRFSELTSGRYDSKHPGISQPTGGGYGATGEHQYQRLYEAMACDRQAGLMAASWGRFQIMGESYKWAGFSAVEDFVDAMRESEHRHLTAFLNFITNKPGCLKNLKQKRWTAFAEHYNGLGEAADPGGPYHERLEKAYNAIMIKEAIGNIPALATQTG